MTKRKKKRKSYSQQPTQTNSSHAVERERVTLFKRIQKNTTIKATFILALVVFFASLLLAIVHTVTDAQIKKLAKIKEYQAIKQVLPGYTIQPDARTVSIDNNTIQYWEGTKEVPQKKQNDSDEKKAKAIKGYAIIVEKQGYSGIIKTMVGINENYRIEAISILSQTETPGLGDRSEEVASQFTFWDFICGRASESGPKRPWFQQQFSGLDALSPIHIEKKGTWNQAMRDELLKINGITAITGATITSTTVRNSIQEGVQRFKNALTSKDNEDSDMEAQ